MKGGERRLGGTEPREGKRRPQAGATTCVPFVDLRVQYHALKPEVDAAIQKVLGSCDFILGDAVTEFEQAFAELVGCAHGVGVSSGVDALRLALQVVGVGPADEVIMPANTFIATALAVSAAGAQPVFIDCDPGTYNLNVGLIETAITRRTKAIIPVHLTGQPADMEPILNIAARRSLHVIEDAAQAHGALYKDRPCGSMGVMGCFSFYPAKNLGAYGDGGMVTTQDAKLAERLKMLRNYGQWVKNEHLEKGFNARLDTIQAAVLKVKLRHLRNWNDARAAHAQQYRDMLRGVGDLVLQQRTPGSTHVYHIFVVETARRDDLRKHLSAAGIQTGIHYPVPIHLQPAYADLGFRRGDFPQTELLASRMLSLPMFAELREDQVFRVAEEIKQFFARFGTSPASAL